MLNENGMQPHVSRSSSVARYGVLAAMVGLSLASCSGRASSPIGPAVKSGDHANTAHSHVAPHGGQLQSVGDNHFELTYDGDTGRFVLYVLGAVESKSAPIAEKEVSLQVRDETSGDFQSAKLGAEPLEGETDGKSSRFSTMAPGLANLGNFTAVARVLVAGESHRASFQFVDGKPISAGIKFVADGYACPMGCEKDKVYPTQGKCPVCKMKLEEHKAGVTAHADHTPKHGGLFFMAPDSWHHLEGTLVTDHELRIYLYDNFTKPMASIGYTGELKVQPVNEQDEEIGEPVTVPIMPVEGKPYLTAQLPGAIKPPVQTEARIQFPNVQEKYLFNFDFKGIQHKD